MCYAPIKYLYNFSFQFKRTDCIDIKNYVLFVHRSPAYMPYNACYGHF